MPKKLSNGARRALLGYQDYLEGREDILPSTATSYLTMTRAFIAWQEQNGHAFAPDRVASTDVLAYRQSLLRQSLRPTTINRILTALRLYFAWTTETAASPANPAFGIRPLPIETGSITASRAEADAMRYVIENHPGTRNASLIAFILLAGMKTNDLTLLHCDDLDLAACTLRLPGVSWQVPIDPAIVRVGGAYFTNLDPHEHIFPSRRGRALTSRAIEYVVASTAIIAGIARHLTPNALRRRFITDLQQNDVPPPVISRLLGHENARHPEPHDYSVEELIAWLPSSR